MELFEYIALFILLILIAILINSSNPNEYKEAKKVIFKILVYMESIYFMILSKDTKGIGPSKNPDPDMIKGKPTTYKRIIFIRHGESDWNDVFNKGFGPGFLIRLFGALLREFLNLRTIDSGILFQSKVIDNRS